MAGTLLVGFGPEQPSQSLSGDAAVSLGREHRQNGESLGTEPGRDSLVDGFERESAERHEVQHGGHIMVAGPTAVNRGLSPLR